MPYLMIQTNKPLESQEKEAVMAKLSATVAQQLGKPERYVMVAMEDSTPMLFAGDSSPAVYMELKSIGLPEGNTKELSQALCDQVQNELGISNDRVYIEFADAARHMWGWNGGTF